MKSIIRKLLSIILSISVASVLGQVPTENVTVKTCCENPLIENNVTWCDGMYSQSEFIHFKYEHLDCRESRTLSFHPESVWQDHSNGFFADYFLKLDDHFYAPKDYCIRRMTEEKVEVNVCRPRCSSGAFCLPKCCNLWDDALFSNNTLSCVPSFEPKVWHPQVYDRHNHVQPLEVKPVDVHFNIYNPSQTSACTSVRLTQNQYFDYKILSSGDVAWTSSDTLNWHKVPKGRFCLDRETSLEDEHEVSATPRVVLVGCLEDFVTTISDDLTSLDTINFIFTQISLVFLTITLIIYTLLRKHQDVQRWVQFFYFFALWSSLLVENIFHGQGEGEGTMDSTVADFYCIFVALLTSIFYYASLTLTAAAAAGVLMETCKRQNERMSFVKVQSIAWVTAALMSAIGTVLTFSGESFSSIAGGTSCRIPHWLGDSIFEGLCHLVAVSILSFSAVRICISKVRGKQEPEVNYYSGLTILMCKYSIVFGIVWTSLALKYLFAKSTISTIKWLLVTTDFMKSLQGFVIFLLFAFNRKTLDSLGQNYSIIRRLSNASTATNVIEKDAQQVA